MVTLTPEAASTARTRSLRSVVLFAWGPKLSWACSARQRQPPASSPCLCWVVPPGVLACATHHGGHPARQHTRTRAGRQDRQHRQRVSEPLPPKRGKARRESVETRCRRCPSLRVGCLSLGRSSRCIRKSWCRLRWCCAEERASPWNLKCSPSAEVDIPNGLLQEYKIIAYIID